MDEAAIRAQIEAMHEQRKLRRDGKHREALARIRAMEPVIAAYLAEYPEVTEQAKAFQKAKEEETRRLRPPLEETKNHSFGLTSDGQDWMTLGPATHEGVDITDYSESS